VPVAPPPPPPRTPPPPPPAFRPPTAGADPAGYSLPLGPHPAASGYGTPPAGTPPSGAYAVPPAPAAPSSGSYTVPPLAGATPSGGYAVPAATAGPASGAFAAPLPPSAPGAARRANPLPWIVGIAALLFLTVAGAVLWWVLRAPEGESTDAGPVPAVTAAPTLGPPVKADEARLLVIATPWAEVTAIAGNGGAVPLPTQRTTPLLLTLPPGRYTLTLAHPTAAAPVTCEVDLVNGQAATCQRELVPVDVMQYFKDAGWWQ
jgi:hypothetical protein